jgi:hypothetical protein
MQYGYIRWRPFFMPGALLLVVLMKRNSVRKRLANLKR